MAPARQAGFERGAKTSDQGDHDGSASPDAEPARADAVELNETVANAAERSELRRHRVAGEPDVRFLGRADAHAASRPACPGVQGIDAGAAGAAERARGREARAEARVPERSGG